MIVYLQFPTIEAFIKYLKNTGVSKVGLVTRREAIRVSEKQPLPIIRYYHRITAYHKPDEILVHDSTFWEGVAYPSQQSEIVNEELKDRKRIREVLAQQKILVEEFEYRKALNVSK